MVQLYKPVRTKTPSAQLISLRIDGLDHHGTGVCRSHQPVVFVDGALPGEEVKARVRERKKRVWRADMEEVLTPSPERITPFCPHFNQCGGCQHQHLGQKPMLNYKQQAVAQLIGKITGAAPLNWQMPLIGAYQGYRRKVRLAVDARGAGGKSGGAKSSVSVGLRARGSDHIVDIGECKVLTLPLQQLLPDLRALIKNLASVRHIGHISLLDADNQLQLCLRITKPLPEDDTLALQAFAAHHQCTLLLQTKKMTFEQLAGERASAFYQPVEQLSLEFTPNDFIQVNNEINRAMVLQAMNWMDISAGDKVLDLFCGVGNFALPMAQKGAQVTGVEGVEAMVEQANANAVGNGLRAEFIQADLGDERSLMRLAQQVGEVDKVLLDPARAGAAELMPWLDKLNPAQILYVSCNPATFARDMGRLIETGWRVNKIGLMDMFPNTAHTELMALFSRH